MVFAPIFRAGQLPLSYAILQVCAVLALLLALWNPTTGGLTKRELTAAALLLLFPLLYLVPVPGAVMDWLPGREPYAAALALLDHQELSAPIRLSLFPAETVSAWLMLLIPVGVFLGTRMLDHKRLYRLVQVLIGIACVQAILGLMQFGAGRESPLYLGMTFTSFGSAVGTYPNRNHLAGLIEMVLPITLALYIYNLGRTERQGTHGWKSRVVFFASMRGHIAFVYGALALLLIIGVIFTRSRTGIALTMLGMLLVTFAFARRIGGDNVYGPAGTVVAFAVGIGIVIGLAPILDRFATLDPLEDNRWTMASATMDGISAFSPIGSGPGTFANVFHAFQPLELGRWFIDHAHNDYLQWLFEGGALAALLILLLLGLYFFQWRKVWTQAAWSKFRFIQVGAGIGIFLLVLHELVDYNLSKPANMVYFAFLVGIFFSPPDKDASPGPRRSGKRRGSSQTQAVLPTADSKAVKPLAPAPDQIKNPFAD